MLFDTNNGRFDLGRSNVPAGKISVISPIARAIMGKREGEEVVVIVPAGELNYEVEKIEHI